jgi:hypothetical protein
MKKSALLLLLCLFALTGLAYADDGVLTKTVHKGDLYILGKGSDEGQVIFMKPVEETIKIKKLSDGYLGPFSLGFGMGAYEGALYRGSSKVNLKYTNTPYNIFASYRKDLYILGTAVIYAKPGIQYNTEADGTQVTAINFDFGVDTYELPECTFFIEMGLNYPLWKDTLFSGMTSDVGFNMNVGGYITDNYAVGTKLSFYRGKYAPGILGYTDYVLTNCMLYFEIR